jgi:hypothetical protein
MADEKPKSDRAIAQQTQEKFEFYLLSLVFTLLALSIQTAKFGASPVADGLELLGWVSFVISGLAALSHIEWIPNIRVKKAAHSEFESEVYELKELLLRGESKVHILDTGKPETIVERIKGRQQAIGVHTPHIAKLERRAYIKYDIHKYGFVVGILLIVMARAMEPSLAVLRAMHML